MQEIRANRFPIGGGSDIPKVSFTNHTLELNSGDSFYLFTDGYADQIGGPKSKRMGTKRLKEQLDQLNSTPSCNRRESLEEFWQNWRGSNEQMDDVLLIGLTLS
jgi:serine phosphatase RsbU (regulator of sigma subunit)